MKNQIAKTHSRVIDLICSAWEHLCRLGNVSTFNYYKKIIEPQKQSRIILFLDKVVVYPISCFFAILNNFERKIKFGKIEKYRRNAAYTMLIPDWHDTDELMLHACFELFVKFMDTEMIHETMFLSHKKMPNGLAACEEILPLVKNASEKKHIEDCILLYKWWVEDRRNLYANTTTYVSTEEDTHIFYVKKYEEHIDDEISYIEGAIGMIDDRMLTKLMSIRRKLWT